MRLRRSATRWLSTAATAPVRGRSVVGRASTAVLPGPAAGGHRRLQLGCPTDPVRELLPVPRAGREEPDARVCGSINAKVPHRVLNADTGRRAIIPGDPDNSELIKRVTHLNVAARMPPSITNKTLTAEKIDVLRRWMWRRRAIQAALVVHLATEARCPGVTLGGPGVDRYRPLHRSRGCSAKG